MKKSDIYEVAIKILGLFMLTYLIDQSYSFTEVWSNVRDIITGDSTRLRSMVMLDLQNLLATFILVWLFIFRTKWLVRRICKHSDSEPIITPFPDRKVIYEIAFILTGMLQIIWTLPEFSIQIKPYLSPRYGRGTSLDFDFIWLYLVKIAFGCILLLVARRLAEYLGRQGSPRSRIVFCDASCLGFQNPGLIS